MNAPPLVIRRATPEDADRLMVLVHDCVKTMREAGIEQWDDIYPDAETINKDIKSSTLDVLCHDQLILACITIDQTLDPLWKDLDWSPDSEPAAAVHRLMVDPTQHGRGHAKVLMQHAEKMAVERGFRSLRLDSFLNNPAAMALYTRLGYRRAGTAMMRKGEFAGFEKLLYHDE